MKHVFSVHMASNPMEEHGMLSLDFQKLTRIWDEIYFTYALTSSDYSHKHEIVNEINGNYEKLISEK